MTDGGQHRRFRLRPTAPRRPVGATAQPTRRGVAHAGIIALTVSLAALVVVGTDVIQRQDPVSATGTGRRPAPPVPGGTPTPSGEGRSTATTVRRTTITTDVDPTSAGRGITPAGSTPAGSTPAGSTPAGPGGPPGGTGSATPTGTAAGGAGSSRCADPANDQDPKRPAELDLLGVAVKRDAAALQIRIEVRVTPTTGGPTGPQISWWEVFLADGAAVLYAVDIRHDSSQAPAAAWSTGVSSFAGPDEYRSTAIAPPTGTVLEFTVAASALTRLPQRFTWWAVAVSDDPSAADQPVVDVCPDAAAAAILDDGEGAGVPPLAARIAFPA